MSFPVNIVSDKGIYELISTISGGAELPSVRRQGTIAAVKRDKTELFLFGFQRGEQAPRLVPRVERNKKLSY